MGKGPFTLTKGPDGTWSVTIPPPVPGFHYYWFILDGVSSNDPGSGTYFGYGRETSGIEIPEVGAELYAEPAAKSRNCARMSATLLTLCDGAAYG